MVSPSPTGSRMDGQDGTEVGDLYYVSRTSGERY